MTPDCAAALAEWWQALPAGGRLCTVPDKGTFLDHQKKVGIARVDERGRHADFHSLRYTFCALLSRKYPIEVVSKLMRHGSLNMTAQIYLDLGLDRQGEGEWVLERLAVPDPTGGHFPTPGPTAAQNEGSEGRKAI
jgi:integrase